MRIHADHCRSLLSRATIVLVLGLALAACGVSAAASVTGTIAGDVVAGPTCPVERVSNPCPPQRVTNREVDIQTTEGATVATTTTDANGDFSVAVPPGDYVVHVRIISGTVGMRQITPGDVTVTANQTSTIHIQLDTGIR
jgi:hypothetical protein